MHFIHSITCHSKPLLSLGLSLGLGLSGCSTKKEEAKPEAASAPAEKGAPAATTPAPKKAPLTITYVNPAPAFQINVPDGFVASPPTKTGRSNTSIRLALEGEHSGIGTAISITWWDGVDGYDQLATQVKTVPDDGKLVAEGKLEGGAFVFFQDRTDKMVKGELVEVDQMNGGSVVKGETHVITCRVSSRDANPSDAFVRACETLTLVAE